MNKNPISIKRKYVLTKMTSMSCFTKMSVLCFTIEKKTCHVLILTITIPHSTNYAANYKYNLMFL